MTLTNEEQLDALLSQPSAADVAAMAEMEGDLLILGAGGKMGPTLVLRAQRALEASGRTGRIRAVSRFSSEDAYRVLRDAGVECIAADLLEPAQVARLPEAANVLFLAGRKFGSSGNQGLTWATNAWLPALVADRFRNSRLVALSSGNIYPLVPIHSGGATEQTPPGPVGEYAQSVLARERLFQWFSERYSIPTLILRLNYAVELRYGVLLDIGRKVFERRPVDVSMPAVNVIWQGDANSMALRGFPLCGTPPVVLNLTGPETLSVRWIAERFGQLFGVAPEFTGTESADALLSNAQRCQRVFGYPTTTPEQVIEWVAAWIGRGGHTLDKPTHFQTRDGQF